MHPEMIEFGERIMYQPLDHKQLGSAMPRWEEGVYVGLRMHTGEKLVATATGVCKARSIKRRIESERWDAEEISKINGTPWKPYLYSEDDQLLSRAPAPAVVDDPDNPKKIRELDKEAVPRSFSIQRKDLVNHGYTPGCQGCYAAANDKKHKPHTPVCRERIAKALMGDESEAHRIIDARDREDAFLEKAIMEGDMRVDNNVTAAPNTSLSGTPTPPTVTPPTPRMESMNPVPITPIPFTHNESLEENDFHDIVNQDQEMYDAIDAMLIGGDDIIG